jgi:hypothetical protein
VIYSILRDLIFIRETKLELSVCNLQSKMLINDCKFISLEEFILEKKKEFSFTFKNENNEIVVHLSVEFVPMIQKELILFYDFKAKFFDSIEDKSSRGINAKIKNLETFNVKKTFGPKKGMGAARFNGLNFLDLFFNPLEGYCEFSISFWFKPAHFDFEKISPIISTNEKSGGFCIGCFCSTFSLKNNEKLELKMNEGIEKDFFLTDIYRDKEWNHKVITFNGNEIFEFFNIVKINQRKVGRLYVASGRRVFFIFIHLLDAYWSTSE